MTKPKVTVGVPVFNSGPMLRDCLQNLREQSFDNFRVLIFDNCSTDETPDIAQEFTHIDSRFHHIRQPENKGSGQNFVDALNAADTEYFLWRADDDRTSDNFLELMVDLLDSHPDANLAVSRVDTHQVLKDVKTSHPFPSPSSARSHLPTILMNMSRSRASWIYGLWRASYFQPRFNESWSRYPFGPAFDHLEILAACLDGAIVGNNRAVFFQQRIDRPQGVQREPATETKPLSNNEQDLNNKIQQKKQNRQSFRILCREELNKFSFPIHQLFILRFFVLLYADRCSHSTFRKIWHLKIKSIIQKIY